jgi:hypothetical protein
MTGIQLDQAIMYKRTNNKATALKTDLWVIRSSHLKG